LARVRPGRFTEAVADTDIDGLRNQLMTVGLEPETLGDDPILAFGRWMDLAVGSGVFEPDAMTVATVDAAGTPSARVVLLRDHDHRGFVWYTDRDSDKGRALAADPRAALVIAWPLLARQVRVEGSVETTTGAESDAYWATRPRGSQLSAVASRQSGVLTSRAELDEARAAVEREYEGRPVPRPSRWGGYRLVPRRIEFWQGREFRAHDRIRFDRDLAGDVADARRWRVVRLSP
jgi:pyridoxamine 5'-phosphate oxidase